MANFKATKEDFWHLGMERQMTSYGLREGAERVRLGNFRSWLPLKAFKFLSLVNLVVTKDARLRAVQRKWQVPGDERQGLHRVKRDRTARG